MKASYSPELDLIDIFFSSSKALERMKGARERDGNTEAEKSGVFQPTREEWAAAVFLLGYSQITKDQYWLRGNPNKSNAPDVFAIALHPPKLPEGKGTTREVMEIEVCEYDDNAQTSLSSHIIKKLEDKAYNPFTFLLCYIHTKGQTRLIDVINGLKGIRTTIREIWLLFHLKDGLKGNFVIARVYLRDADLVKTNLSYKGNYIQLAKIPQQEMIKLSKGTSKKLEFEHLGLAYVPLPQAKIKKDI